MAELVDVSPAHIDYMWPQVGHWIEDAANSSSCFTVDEVKAKLKNGHAQMWLAWNGAEADAVCVTFLEQTTKGKHCHIWIMVGRDRESWQPLMAELEQWAKREGCNRMRHEARPGWSKILKASGYQMPHVCLEKEI